MTSPQLSSAAAQKCQQRNTKSLMCYLPLVPMTKSASASAVMKEAGSTLEGLVVWHVGSGNLMKWKGHVFCSRGHTAASHQS